MTTIPRQAQDSQFGSDVLLIFLGHSDDATAEAEALRDVERDLQRELEQLLRVKDGSTRFATVRLWEWKYDAAARVGGQEQVISPELILDIAGNVQEWCQDWWDSEYHAMGPMKNPQGPDSGEHRVVRGGSWGKFSTFVRSAVRDKDHPAIRLDSLGLRVVSARGVTPFASGDDAKILGANTKS